jgi:hypothetical protein
LRCRERKTSSDFPAEGAFQGKISRGISLRGGSRQSLQPELRIAIHQFFAVRDYCEGEAAVGIRLTVYASSSLSHIPGVQLVKGTISTALDVLAKGLSPFVADRLRTAFGDDWLQRNSVAHNITSADPAAWDAHVVLVLMWEHWNQVFRHDLSFVERSLVSELREYRNRWAHQRDFNERDTYRCLDGIERLLRSVGSASAAIVDELRRESLQRLHDNELVESIRSGQDWFTGGVTAVCGVILSVAVVLFFPKGFSLALGGLIILVFGRLVYRMTRPTIIITTGPRQCFECGRVFYGDGCPYCDLAAHIGTNSTTRAELAVPSSPAATVS